MTMRKMSKTIKRTSYSLGLIGLSLTWLVSLSWAQTSRFDEVFIYQGRSGPVVLDRPISVHKPVQSIVQPPANRPFEALIQRIAAETRLDPELIHAVIQVESDYQPQAVSIAGARGLMQLMPVIIEAYGVTNAFDPEQNIRAGSQFLAFLLDKYGDQDLALAAYHAGETAVDRAGGIPPISATRNYVARVNERYRMTRQLAAR